MASEKRKLPDEWIKATVLSDDGSRGTYLARFSGVVPPETTTFREFKRKRTDDRGTKDVILQGETERIEFEGRTVGTDDSDNCQYAVGILDGEKGTIKLLPAPLMHMQRSIKALKSKAAKAAPVTSAKIQEQRMALGKEFGSKRSKAAIQSQLSSQVDTKALENLASTIYENIKVATENIPSQDALQEEVDADRPIPSIDLSASTPDGLYSLESIVSESELNMIDAESIYSLPDEASRIAAMPHKSSKFINERLKTLFKQEAPDHHRLRMIFYASLLTAFYKNNRLASKRGALKAALGPLPNPLLDGLYTRYTEDQLTSTKEDAKKRSVCTERCQDKVLCFLFVLCLILDDFTLDITLLAHDLQLKPNKAVELFKTVGCKIVPLSETERERRGITKSEAKGVKVARLKCPPEFPKVRRPKARTGRR